MSQIGVMFAVCFVAGISFVLGFIIGSDVGMREANKSWGDVLRPPKETER